MSGRNRQVRRLLAALLLVALASSGCGGTTSTDEGATSPSFYEMFHAQSLDYEPFSSVRSLAGSSEIVAIGNVVSVLEGRNLGGPRGRRGTVPTMLARIKVSKAVRGTEAGSVLDVEFYRPNLFDAEDLNRARPSEPVFVFLSDTARLPSPAAVDDQHVQRDRSKPLYAPTSVQGWIIETGDGLVAAFDEGGGNESFRRDLERARTFEGLEEMVTGA